MFCWTVMNSGGLSYLNSISKGDFMNLVDTINKIDLDADGNGDDVDDDVDEVYQLGLKGN